MKIKNLIILISIFLGIGILGYVIIKIILPDYTITSWWRSSKHNEEVGGVPLSSHLVGLGYDVSPKPSQEKITFLKQIFKAVLTNYPNHIHVGWYG